MNQYQDTSGLSLPKPSLDGGRGVLEQSEMPSAQLAQPTQRIANPQSMQDPTSASSPMPPELAYQSQPQLQPIAVQPAGRPQVQQTLEQPSVAELDDESLDIEWVQKAKNIVDQTEADPFAESNALAQLKIEYLQKRFGKEIKAK